MRAIRQHEFGPAENLRLEEVPDPRPDAGQVLVTVRAAGVHLLDAFIRRGEHGGPFPVPELPMTPGREVAGVVAEVGAGVEESWLGKRVVAHLGAASGGYAELARVNAASLHELPDHVTDEDAVAMIGTGRTAFGILRVAELTEHDVVLVPAAAGGLGALFVQEAKALGARVVGAASTGKLDLVRELGADLAVDYTGQDWADEVRAEVGEVSVVLDGVGGAVGRKSLELLGVGGRIVMFGWSSGEPTRVETADLYNGGLTATVAVGPRILKGMNLRELETLSLRALADGRLTPRTTTFPLADAAKAQDALENRATTGKVVLTP
ncbi:zinc-binding dehydrogenase [Actinosynnema sp. NPDC047251]|uniref:Alcohol dehydrogenase zinc-binding domain-containing protein n=1 Tax=Saccharothrix espanaensis (strain ATCC 51144 / DSM 44229 / JCM 9112 / NBRC 15066 / NRRL 15764) TaxID=1179773 RepID=K0KA98_SACES|nr:zinc-binding dehydrogenase [Saccharothrix espanaensis]CCH33734.1 Alcohol dehydrogenase zinc-binding domain-containing protein [Saccharothrix espanaensis DSM 44229]